MTVSGLTPCEHIDSLDNLFNIGKPHQHIHLKEKKRNFVLPKKKQLPLI